MYSTGQEAGIKNKDCLSDTYKNNLEKLRIANLARFGLDKAKDQEELNKRKPTLVTTRKDELKYF